MMFKVILQREANSASAKNIETWHKRLGHVNRKSLIGMANQQLVEGITLSRFDEFFCESCQLGKQHRLPCKSKKQKRKTDVGEFIHTDLCGPMSEASIGGSKYFFLLKDDYSSFRHVYFIRHKDDTFEKFKEFELVFNRFGRKIKTIRSDNGTEFKNDRMFRYMASRGITLETSAPYVHEQNGRAEREMRTVDSARTMLNERKLPIKLWAEAVNTAVYTLNRCPSSQTGSVTPFELWYKKKPDVSHIRIFGSDAYVYVPKEQRKKWDPKSKKLMLVGYHHESTNYRLFNSATNQIVIAKGVIINENSVQDIDNEKSRFTVSIEDNGDVAPAIDPPRNNINGAEGIHCNEERENEPSVRTDDTGNIENSNREARYNLRKRESIKIPSRYEACFTLFNEPKSYQEAVSGEQSMNKEVSYSRGA